MRPITAVRHAICAIIIVSTSPVLAQQPGPANSTEQTGGPKLEEIVVTAQRRSERLQDVPIAVTAISSTKLSAAGVSTTQELSFAVPSLNYNNSSGFAQPFIRGVGSSFTQPNADSSIATYVDGVYLADTQATDFDLLAVDRVEVLRGPQGTLYGRNATGGAINVYTRTPTNVTAGKLSFGYGTYNRKEGSGYLEGKLADGLVGGFYFGVTNHDPYATNSARGPLPEEYTDDTSLGLRSKLVWTPRADLKFTLSGDLEGDQNADTTAYRQVEPEALGYLLSGVPGFGSTPGPAVCSKYLHYCANSPVLYDRHAFSTSFKAEADLGWASLTSLTAYHYNRSREFIDEDSTNTNLISYAAAPQKSRQGSEELQLASPAGRMIKWIAGLYGLDEVGGYYPTFIYVPVAGVNYRQTGNVHTQSAAVFGQVTVPLIEHLNLTLGGRYTIDRKSLRDDQGFLVDDFGTVPISPVAFINIPNQHKVWDKFTPKATLDYKLGDTLLYAEYSEGYKSGVYNIPVTSADAVGPVSPEILKSYEAGIKSDWFGSRLRLNLSGYYYDYSNLQVSVLAPPPINTVILANAATAKLYGGEADATFAATEQLTLTANIALSHSDYVKFLGFQSYAVTPGGNVAETIDASGNQLQRAPRFTGSAGATYLLPMRGGSELRMTGDLYYNGGFYWDPSNTIKQARYALVNASADYVLPNGKWDIAVWGKNLSNHHYAIFRDVSSFGGNQVDAPPFTFGANVTYRFGR